jgi:ATP-dependent protease ClpP protease subunit
MRKFAPAEVAAYFRIPIDQIDEENSMKNHRPKLKPCFRAALQSDGTLELLVYEEIGIDWWTGEGVTASTVKQQIDGAGNYSKIAVRINSPGGDAFEGVAIFNLLRAQGKPVDVFVDGIAASAASIIAMAGDTRTMGGGAMLMIHNAWASCTGYAEDMRKMGDTLDKVSGSVADIFVARAGLTAEKSKELMDAESWLTAAESMELGLATAVAEPLPGDELALALAKSFKALKRLKQVPAALKNDEPEPEGAARNQDGDCSCYCAQCSIGNCAGCACDGCDSVNCDADSCNCANNAGMKAPLDIYERELEAVELSLRT